MLRSKNKCRLNFVANLHERTFSVLMHKLFSPGLRILQKVFSYEFLAKRNFCVFRCMIAIKVLCISLVIINLYPTNAVGIIIVVLKNASKL